MSDIEVINTYSGELTATVTMSGELEPIDFFPQPLEDSHGIAIIDSEGNDLIDWAPGPHRDSFRCELVPMIEITGSLGDAYDGNDNLSRIRIDSAVVLDPIFG